MNSVEISASVSTFLKHLPRNVLVGVPPRAGDARQRIQTGKRYYWVLACGTGTVTPSTDRPKLTSRRQHIAFSHVLLDTDQPASLRQLLRDRQSTVTTVGADFDGQPRTLGG